MLVEYFLSDNEAVVRLALHLVIQYRRYLTACSQLTLTHSHSLSLALTHSHSLSLALTHSHSHSLTLTHSHSHSLSSSLTLTHSQAHSLARSREERRSVWSILIARLSEQRGAERQQCISASAAEATQNKIRENFFLQ